MDLYYDLEPHCLICRFFDYDGYEDGGPPVCNRGAKIKGPNGFMEPDNNHPPYAVMDCPAYSYLYDPVQMVRIK